jgi:hypothetical protein
MYVCVYVCMYVCMYVCVCMGACVRARACKRERLVVYMYSSVFTDTDVALFWRSATFRPKYSPQTFHNTFKLSSLRNAHRLNV